MPVGKKRIITANNTTPTQKRRYTKAIVNKIKKTHQKDYADLLKRIPTHMVDEVINKLRSVGKIDPKNEVSPHVYEEIMQQLCAKILFEKIEQNKKEKAKKK